MIICRWVNANGEGRPCGVNTARQRRTCRAARATGDRPRIVVAATRSRARSARATPRRPLPAGCGGVCPTPGSWSCRWPTAATARSTSHCDRAPTPSCARCRALSAPRCPRSRAEHRHRGDRPTTGRPGGFRRVGSGTSLRTRSTSGTVEQRERVAGRWNAGRTWSPTRPGRPACTSRCGPRRGLAGSGGRAGRRGMARHPADPHAAPERSPTS